MQALDFFAQSYYKSDELEQSELNFKKTLDISQKTNSKPQEAKKFDDLGLVYTKIKKIPRQFLSLSRPKTWLGNVKIRRVRWEY